ncbi:MAG: TDT family transporter [Spirochaetaceae bacterium]|jgi:exfoliative toxin A/B|nr:TDT family transporter [Spirochaetaceae bacterium]
MMKFVKSIPMALCGVSLGLAALGNLMAQNSQPALRMACGILSALVLLAFLLKVLLHFPHAGAELKTPIPLSVLPTSTMALMLLSVYVKDYIHSGIAPVLWYAALALHIGIMLLFVKRFILGFKLGAVFPSWFITFVGIVAASVSAPAMNARLLGQIIFYIGFALYFIALVLVVWRMVKVKLFPEPARPTIAIFTAPMSLCIVGYFQSFAPEQRNPLLIYLMLGIGLASYLYVLVMMIPLLRIKFYPTYAAFTFPFVISALAFRAGNGFLTAQGYGFFAPVMYASFWIALAFMVFVIIHYLRYFVFWLKF